MNFIELKKAISTLIKSNGNRDISGEILQGVLINIIGQVGEYATFAGIATPKTIAPQVDGGVFFLATQVGNYTNFELSINDSNSLGIIYNSDNSWRYSSLLGRVMKDNGITWNLNEEYNSGAYRYSQAAVGAPDDSVGGDLLVFSGFHRTGFTQIAITVDNSMYVRSLFEGSSMNWKKISDIGIPTKLKIQDATHPGKPFYIVGTNVVGGLTELITATDIGGLQDNVVVANAKKLGGYTVDELVELVVSRLNNPFVSRRNLSRDTDLNTVVDQGTYKLYNHSLAANVPTNAFYGHLLVFKDGTISVAEESYVTQIAHSMTDSENVYIRRRGIASADWKPWKKIATETVG